MVHVLAQISWQSYRTSLHVSLAHTGFKAPECSVDLEDMRHNAVNTHI